MVINLLILAGVAALLGAGYAWWQYDEKRFAEAQERRKERMAEEEAKHLERQRLKATRAKRIPLEERIRTMRFGDTGFKHHDELLMEKVLTSD